MAAKTLGPAVRFDDSNTNVLLDAIQSMSDPAFVLKPCEGYQVEADGMFRDGKQLTDFSIKSVKHLKSETSAGTSVSGIA